MDSEKIRQDLQRLFIYFFGELGASYAFVSNTVRASQPTISRWLNSEVMPPTRFLPEFIARIRESAEGIRDNGSSYASEYSSLFREAPKNRIKPRGHSVDPSQIPKWNKKEYAHAMADAWAKCRTGIPRIFRYRKKIRGDYQDMMGCLFVLYNKFLSKDLRKPAGMPMNQAKPCLAIAYKTETHTVYFFAEDGRDITAPMIVKKAKKLKEPVPLAMRDISDICLAFFRRNNYDPRSDLKAQIEGLCDADGSVHYGRYESNHLTKPRRAPGHVLAGGNF